MSHNITMLTNMLESRRSEDEGTAKKTLELTNSPTSLLFNQFNPFIYVSDFAASEIN